MIFSTLFLKNESDMTSLSVDFAKKPSLNDKAKLKRRAWFERACTDSKVGSVLSMTTTSAELLPAMMVPFLYGPICLTSSSCWWEKEQNGILDGARRRSNGGVQNSLRLRTIPAPRPGCRGRAEFWSRDSARPPARAEWESVRGLSSEWPSKIATK